MFRRMTRERYLTDDELARFMRVVRERRHIHQPRDHALFALLANTGMRPAEVRALTRGDCHLEGPEPWIRVMRLKKKKHIPEFDDLPLSRPLAAVLQQHLDTSTDDPIFPIAPKPMRQLFHYYRNEAGLDPARLYLRHTAATRLYASTRNLSLVQFLFPGDHLMPDNNAPQIASQGQKFANIDITPVAYADPEKFPHGIEVLIMVPGGLQPIARGTLPKGMMLASIGHEGARHLAAMHRAVPAPPGMTRPPGL